MAKRDFIVEKKPDFIEKQNKTTILAIVAIVAIVVVVASMMKVQEVGIFSEDREPVVGLAAETFSGLRHVQLERSEVLVTHVSTSAIQRTYYAYLQDNLLVVLKPHGYRQAVLEEQADGLLKGTYGDGDRDVEVVVNERANQILLHNLMDPNLPALSGTKRTAYDGNIRVAGDEYSFRVFGDQLVTSTDDVVSLSSDSEGLLVGEWDGREVIFNSQTRVLMIHDFY